MTSELQKICNQSNYPATFRYQSYYDHSYYFISTFIADHFKHHAFALNLKQNIWSKKIYFKFFLMLFYINITFELWIYI